MLVKVTWGISIPWVQFGCNSKVCEPVCLDSLPECLWFVCWNNVTVSSNLEKFCFSLWVFFFFSKFSCVVSITFTKNHYSFTSDVHSVKLISLSKSFWVVKVVKFCKSIFDIFLIVKVAFFVSFFGTYCMARATLFHKFCKDTCFISISPFLSHGWNDFGTCGTFFPEWDDHFFLDFEVFFCYCEVNDFTVVHVVHVFKSMAAQFWECRSGLWAVTFFTNDEFIFTDVKFFVLEEVEKCFCTEFRNRACAFIKFVSFCFKHSSFNVDMWLCAHAFCSESSCSFC